MRLLFDSLKIFLLVFCFNINAKQLNVNNSIVIEVDQYIAKLYKKLDSSIIDKNISNEEKVEKLKDIIKDNLDIDIISMIVLPKSALNSPLLNEFKRVYLSYLAKSYTSTKSLNIVSDHSIEVISIKPISDIIFMVSSNATDLKTQKTYELKYLLSIKPNGSDNIIKICDVLDMSNLSILTLNRSDFRRVVMTEG